MLAFFSVLDLHPEDQCIIKLKVTIVIDFSKYIYIFRSIHIGFC